MDNNSRTILATVQKPSPTLPANQITFSYPLKIQVLFFNLLSTSVACLVTASVQKALPIKLPPQVKPSPGDGRSHRRSPGNIPGLFNGKFRAATEKKCSQ